MSIKTKDPITSRRESLCRSVLQPIPRLTSGRIAVQAINHLGDEVMKVFSVG